MTSVTVTRLHTFECQVYTSANQFQWLKLLPGSRSGHTIVPVIVWALRIRGTEREDWCSWKAAMEHLKICCYTMYVTYVKYVNLIFAILYCCSPVWPFLFHWTHLSVLHISPRSNRKWESWLTVHWTRYFLREKLKRLIIISLTALVFQWATV